MYRPQPARREVADDLTLVAAGGEGPDFNLAFVYGPVEPDAVFARGAAFFGEGRAFSVCVEDGAAPALEAALRGRGWNLDEEEPGMVLCDLPQSAPPPPLGLEIVTVGNAGRLAEFRRMSGTGARYVPSLEAATDPGVALLIGYVDGVPVATARLACLDNVVEITGVVTVPEMRHRGFGTAMTWAAVVEGRRRGCTAAALTASELGYPVYLRMGFLPVTVFRTYMPAAGD
jgi:GNAT superfamily N-acetyltransferase